MWIVDFTDLSGYFGASVRRGAAGASRRSLKSYDTDNRGRFGEGADIFDGRCVEEEAGVEGGSVAGV